MNSKIIICLGLLLTLTSCGVKGPPVKYRETIVDSYVKDYTGTELSAEEKERTKDKQSIPSTLDQQQQKIPVKP
ncbi:lipoprotein [Bacteriovorax sp. PP10]|uniref:Lipoprotein n=1 Tax=Bacteriovorax antarcticus TaxID=3088717 RepID=A0ABU5VPC6_9BACT|nr:lipoprotein [Bacteriovorax sp. PP10]MEA9354856.1 lipoprotein [Bacteriovorax sp. PP10]